MKKNFKKIIESDLKDIRFVRILFKESYTLLDFCNEPKILMSWLDRAEEKLEDRLKAEELPDLSYD